MTTYFDDIISRLDKIALEQRAGADLGTAALEAVERQMVRDVSICTMLPGFPKELRMSMQETILRYAVCTREPELEPADFEYNSTWTDRLREMASDLHGSFHALGNLHLDAFTDDPLQGLNSLLEAASNVRLMIAHNPPEQLPMRMPLPRPLHGSEAPE